MNIIKTAINRPVTVAMFTLAALVFGLVLLNRLGFNLLPELTYPTLTVRTEFEGAAPAEVENLISRPLEGVLGTIKGLRQVRSVSKAGRSDIYLEFHWGTNIELASLDVREKLEQVQLPLEISAPSLLRFNPNNDPIIRLSLAASAETDKTGSTSGAPGLAELRRYADLTLSRRLETIEGVAAAKASGGFEDEIQILVDQDELARLSLSVNQIASQLQSQNVNVSGGQIRNGQQQLLVRTFNEYKSIDDFSNAIIKADGNKLVRLKDIARIEFGHKDPTAIIRHNGEQAVELAIYKEGDANTVRVAERVHKEIDELKKSLPANMQLTILADASEFISMALTELVNAAIFGGILSMVVIYLFLGDFSATRIISMAIPLSVIMTFNLMFYAKIDLNIMSLGGLALAVGMLVDNAIVVLENIASKKEKGLSAIDAALEGAKEVSGAITASTLTTIAVFLPLIFVEGIAGQLFNDQALTITFSLLISLAVALTVIPTMAARTDKNQKAEKPFTRSNKSILARILLFPFELIVLLLAFIFLITKTIVGTSSKTLGFIFKPLRLLFDKFYSIILFFYRHLLEIALSARAMTLFVAVLLFIVSIYAVKQIDQVVLPEMAQGQLVVKAEFPPGTAIESTDQKVISLSKQMQQLAGVREVFATSGMGSKLTANPEQGGDNYAEFNLLLEAGLSRGDESRLLTQLRLLIANSGFAVTADAERPQLFSFSTPLSIELYGFELNALQQTADKFIHELNKNERFIDLHTNMKKGYPEAQVEFDQEKMAALGISTEQATNAIVNAIRGNKATRYRLREQQIDVLVRLEQSARDEASDLEKLIINPTSARPIPLSAIATIQLTEGPSEIMRIDQQRVVIIEGQIAFGGIDDAVAEAKSLIKDLQLPAGANYRFGGQSEEMDRSYQSLLAALALAVFMVYLVMASQFESLLHPFIILLSVPLAAIGAIWALIFTHTELSVVVFLGLIMLAGIVVNNAIVLIDKVNQLRATGATQSKAIKEAGEARLRPILMTTLTTVLGMLPLALGFGEGAEVRAPMAITVIGGLIVSTLLTLVVIPVMYSLLDRKSFATETTINRRNSSLRNIDAEAH